MSIIRKIITRLEDAVLTRVSSNAGWNGKMDVSSGCDLSMLGASRVKALCISTKQKYPRTHCFDVLTTNAVLPVRAPLWAFPSMPAAWELCVGDSDGTTHFSLTASGQYSATKNPNTKFSGSQIQPNPFERANTLGPAHAALPRRSRALCVSGIYLENASLHCNGITLRSS